MPPKEAMTWSPGQRRWLKKYRGKMFAVSCRQLGCPPSKDASRAAANSWWGAKQAELDTIPESPKKSHWEKQRDERAAWHRSRGEDDSADELEAKTEGQMRDDFVSGLTDQIVMHQLGMDSENVTQSAVWADRIHNSKKPAISTDRQIRSQIQSFLDHKEAQVIGKERSVGRWGSIKAHLDYLAKWLGEDQSIDVLNSAKVLDFYTYLQKTKEIKSSYKRDIFATAKQFIQHLAELDLIPFPGNLRSRSLTFAKQKRHIATFTVDELGTLLGASTDRTKLYILLAMNCGFTQIDLSDLTHEEIDWKEGRIIRQRSKTKTKKNTPIVNYPLWSETLRLLKQSATGPKSPSVLMTDENKSLVQELIENGSQSRVDVVRSAYERTIKKLKSKGITFLDSHTNKSKTFTDIRNTSSTMLDDHEEFSRFAQYFLGHSPHTVAEAHYVVPSQRRFDLAVAWLGTKYGL